MTGGTPGDECCPPHHCWRANPGSLRYLPGHRAQSSTSRVCYAPTALAMKPLTSSSSSKQACGRDTLHPRTVGMAPCQMYPARMSIYIHTKHTDRHTHTYMRASPGRSDHGNAAKACMTRPHLVPHGGIRLEGDVCAEVLELGRTVRPVSEAHLHKRGQAGGESVPRCSTRAAFRS